MSSAKWRPFCLCHSVLTDWTLPAESCPQCLVSESQNNCHHPDLPNRLSLKKLFTALLCAFVRRLLSGVPDYFYRNKISSGGDLSHYSSASLY